MVFTSRGSDERPLHETRQIVGLQINFTGSDSVFLGSQEGDKRLIRVDENKLVVGLKSVCSEDNTFHQFSLVQQSLIEPSDHAVGGSLSQPNQGSKFQYIQGHRTIVEQAREIFNSDAEPYLWYRELPPATLRLSPFYGLNQNQDIVPIKHFVFGSTEEEMADIKSIAVDIELCGFQVDYGNRPSKSFGPRLHALKTLTIDGKGGERVDRVTVNPRKDDKVPLIRIDTNRNRTLIVGDATQQTTPIELTDEDQRLRPCGLTASWSGTTYAPWLRTIGIMGSPATGHVDMADLPPEVDSNGFLWAPSRPPSGLGETGPVVGKQAVAQKPWGGCIVSWLDISRPLSSVRMTIAYSVHALRVHISAITFKYSDGDHDEVSIGPDKFFPKAPCNWCRYCDREPEGKRFPHYRHETWEVGGNKLSGLRLWTRGSEGLDAIQFIADGEAKMQSPVWGVWMQAPEGLEPSLIQFAGHGSGEATALKVFLGDNMQRDTIVYGFQALVPL